LEPAAGYGESLRAEEGDGLEETPFGRYRLRDLLGHGGMGEVWRAYDTATNRIVALKVLLPHSADDEEFQRRFRREAEVAAGLSDPHVVPIHDYGEIDGRLYVNMRLIDGRDLGEVLRVAGGRLPPARAVHLLEQVAEALEAAHAVGLVHRDIKPSNILVTPRDFVYLIDFGIGACHDFCVSPRWDYYELYSSTTEVGQGRASTWC
jgi:serine/threonine protein kinase